MLLNVIPVTGTSLLWADHNLEIYHVGSSVRLYNSSGNHFRHFFVVSPPPPPPRQKYSGLGLGMGIGLGLGLGMV